MFRQSTTRIVSGLGLVLVLAAPGCRTDPKLATAEYLKSGDRYVEEKKFSEAIVQYRNALQQDPKSAEARLKLAETYVEVGDGPGALREYVRAADLLPDRVDVQVKAATLLLMGRQFTDARARAEKALAKDPNNVDARIVRGNALANLKEYDAAIRQLEEANQLSPTARAYASIGTIKDRSGDSIDAERAFRAAVSVDPKNVGAHLALANYFLSTSRWNEAETTLKGALALDPDNMMANRGMVALYKATGRGLEAEPYLKSLAAKDVLPGAPWKMALADYFSQTGRPSDAKKILTPLDADKRTFAPSRTRLAAIQYDEKNRDLAHQTIEEVLKRAPKDIDALVMKTRFLLAEQKADEALQAAQAAVTANPQSAAAQYALGMVQRARRKPDEAIAAFNEVLKLNPQAVAAQYQLSELNLMTGKTEAALDLAQDAAKAMPRLAGLQLNLARNLIASKEFGRAEPIVTQLVTKYPNIAVTQSLAGTLALAKKDPPAARKSYEKALALDPGNLEALTGLTSIDVTQKSLPAARARLDAALAKAPNNPDLLVLAGRTYLLAGDQAAGEAAFKKAVEVSPQSMAPYSLLAALYVRQNKLDQALAECDQVQQKNPKSVGAPTLAGVILLAQGKYDQARKRFEQGLQIDPNAPVAANNLAYLYAEQGGNLDVALQLAQTAKAGLPDLPEVNDTLGYIYLKKDLASLAIPPLQAAAEKDPGSWMYHYHLGLAYAKSGDKGNARKALEKALAINQSFPGAEDAKKTLAGL